MRDIDKEKEGLTPGHLLPGEEVWVLQVPGSVTTIMLVDKDGRGVAPITFDSEEEAWEFARVHDVPGEFSPALIKIPGQRQ